MKKKRPRVTLKDIATEAGVSVGTVSNALNRPEVVTAATRDKVNAAVRALDFTPDAAATTLRTGHTRLIGLVIPDVTNPFYAEITSAVIESAASQGYSVILCESKDDPATELQQLELLSQRSADGAIVVPIGADQNRLNRLRAKGTHLVLLDRAAKPHEGCSVSIDDVYGGELAASLVLDAGATDIVFINGDLSINQCRDRHQGVKQAFDAREIGFAVLREITVDEMSAAEGRSTAARIVAEDPEHLPDAFLCANDLIATGVITALAAAGVRVPEDVAVVGYGDLIHPADSVVPLTTIDQPKRALGVAAVELLIKEIAEEEHDHRHTSTVFAPRLVIRESAL